MGNRKIYLIIISFLLSLFLTIVATSLFLNFNNILRNKSDWVSTKTLFEKPIFCANAFVDSRPALSGNRLNLEVWHGFQEVFYVKNISFSKITYDFYLSDDASLIFIFNMDNKKYSGIWFSANDDYSSCYFEANSEGKFLKKVNISLSYIKSDKWNKFTLVNTANNYLLINGEILKDIKINIADDKKIGFRSYNSYATKTIIDNLKIVLKDGQIIKEDFSNYENSFLFFVLSLFILLLVDLFVLKKGYKNIYIYLYLKILVLFFFLFYMVIDLFFLSTQYDHFFVSKHQVIDSVKSVDFISDELRCYELNENQYRIVLLGTSQTWGEGAQQESQTISRQLEKKMTNRFPNFRIKCINLSIPGSSSKQLWQLYIHENWGKFEPKIMIINLGNNDREPQILYATLEKIILDNKKNSVITILSKEASYFQLNEIKPNAVILQNYQVLESLAKKYNVVLVDLNSYIQTNKVNGLTWWDSVHLSAYGQELAANLYYQTILVNIFKNE